MQKKEVGAPVMIAVITVVVLAIIGFGYFYLNKDSLGKEGVPRKLGPPGVMPSWADPKMGPFPRGTGPGGAPAQPGAPDGKMSGAGAPPPGAKLPGN